MTNRREERQSDNIDSDDEGRWKRGAKRFFKRYFTYQGRLFKNRHKYTQYYEYAPFPLFIIAIAIGIVLVIILKAGNKIYALPIAAPLFIVAILVEIWIFGVSDGELEKQRRREKRREKLRKKEKN